jgi:dipeptidyl aminopeptidase/acylaminoacyl peptidase
MLNSRMKARLRAVGVALAVAVAVPGTAHATTGRAPQPDAYHDQPPLAYVSQGQVFVLDGKGRPPRRVRGVTNACCVAFSPDGYYVAFQRRDDLWVVEHDGTELHRVARAVERWAWAPDGQALAVIPKTGPDVSGRTGVEFYGARDSSINETLLPEYRVLDLAWAGYGRRLAASAVVAGNPRPDTRAEVFMLEVPGPYGEDCPALCPEEPLRIPVEHPAGTSGPLFAAWSPNVDSIAVWTAPENGSTLGLVSPRGGDIAPIASTLVRRSWVQWSRTGDRLLVVQGGAREADAPRALLLCTRLGGCSSITGSDRPVADPAWSRAGSMAYVSSERRELWLANGDGGDARRIAGAGDGVHAPRWLPDARHLVFVADRLVWLLDTARGEAVPVAGPLDRAGGDRMAPAREPTDQSPGTRWEQLYSVAP